MPDIFRGTEVGGNMGEVVSISSDGLTIAFTERISSVVYVYTYANQTWELKGSAISIPDVGDNGNTICLSGDGNFLAYGQPYGTVIPATLVGIAGVYEWDGEAWAHRGSVFEGTEANPTFGKHVKISHDGSILVVSNPDEGDTILYGTVSTYEWSGTDYVLIGSALTDSADYEMFGEQISLNKAGDVLAISSNYSTADGEVYVYQLSGGSWSQIGDTFTDVGNGNDLGYSTALSDNGFTLAITSGSESSGTNASGVIRTYSWNGTAWTQLGNELSGPDDYFHAQGFGDNLSLSGDGLRLVTSFSIGNEDIEEYSALLRTYELSSNVWSEVYTQLPFDTSGNVPSKISANGSGLIIGMPWLNSDMGGASVYSLTSLGWTQLGGYTVEIELGDFETEGLMTGSLSFSADISFSGFTSEGSLDQPLSGDIVFDSFVVSGSFGESVVFNGDIVFPAFTVKSSLVSDLQFDNYEVWVMNAETGHHSTYTNWPVNSHGIFNDVELIATEEGIFLASGDDDDGVVIKPKIYWPPSEFGDKQLKALDSVFVRASCQGTLTFVAIFDEGEKRTYSFDTIGYPDGHIVKRVKPGKGLRGRLIQCGIEGEGDAPVSLESIEVHPVVLKRRLK